MVHGRGGARDGEWETRFRVAAAFALIAAVAVCLSLASPQGITSLEVRSESRGAVRRSKLQSENPPVNASDMRTRTGAAENDCLLRINSMKLLSLYSQNKEDSGILQTLRCTGGHGTKEYFEFGSQTGVEVNTRMLRDLYGWKGHLLDGGHEDPAIPLHKEFFSPSNIVALMEKYHVSKRLDVLSIDADFDDLYIMREILLAGYKPRVLITEYNRNFGPEWSVSVLAKPIGEESKIWWKGDCYQGASATALIKMAGAFGYTPVANIDGVNLIFVRVDLAKDMNLLIPHPDNFPGPIEPAIHRPCSNKEWAVFDDDRVALATTASVTHAELVKALPIVTLLHKTYKVHASSDLPGSLTRYGETYRTFEMKRLNQTGRI